MVKRQLSLTRHPSTAPRLPDFLRQSTVWGRIAAFCCKSAARCPLGVIRSSPLMVVPIECAAEHLNFYRVHLLVFIFTPLVFSGIFYASNGPSAQNQIAYVDALFMCTSGMAVTGLNSVLLADLTTWQQFIIFVRTSLLVH